MSFVHPHNVSDDEDDSFILATVRPAKGTHVNEVLMSNPTENDTRSNWVWVRMRDGSLLLGVFPQGDTYISMSDAGVCDFLDVTPANASACADE